MLDVIAECKQYGIVKGCCSSQTYFLTRQIAYPASSPASFSPVDVNRKCWYVTTKGMHAVGQAEVVVLLQCLPDEKSIPKDIFSHFVQLYQEALAGKTVMPSSQMLRHAALQGGSHLYHQYILLATRLRHAARP